MLSRRLLLTSSPALALPSFATRAQSTPGVLGEDVELEEFDSPDINALTPQQPFGVNPPSRDQVERATKAVNETPSGPHPIDIAESFIKRYGSTDPDFISQWPRPAAWNPLIVGFFSSTSLKANNDMIDWCAAFVNWCLYRNHKPYTNNAGSQSFINSGKFSKVASPLIGDLAVFTCYDNTSGHTLGIGHVGFFKEDLGNDRISLIAGNQSGSGHSSIISQKTFSTKASPTTRHIDGKAIPCTFKFNSYLRVS